MASHILVVDNNKTNLEFMRYLFASQGHEVITAETVAKGLALLHEASPPDLIICDLNLPDRNGFELLEEVKKEAALQSIPFIIISSTSWARADVDKSLKLGAVKFIHRPIEPLVLLAEIEPFLRKTNK